MSYHHKVVWYEGMNLDPHHFQQWDRHFRYLVDLRVRSIKHHNWGIIEVDLDKDALLNGHFSLLRCKGVTQDGLVFNMPDEDTSPNSRSFQDFFPATESELGVFLAIPVEQERGSNCSLEGIRPGRETRYHQADISITDDNTGADERQIGIGRTNFQLRFGTESKEDYSALKVAEIHRSPDGGFKLSGDFIPTCLCVDASETLMATIRSLLELIIAKSSALGAAKDFKGRVEFSAKDITTFWALQTLNMNIPLLNHFNSVGKSHPEGLYLSLLAMAGQLSTFTPELNITPRSFPTYDHNNLTNCFRQLQGKIRQMLDGILPTANYVQIPLEKEGESLYQGRIGDTNLLQSARFFLKVSSDQPERKIIDEIPTNLRVASPDTINAVLSSFRTALPLKHTSVPPNVLPMQEGTMYFLLEPTGPFWDAIYQSNALSIFVPKELRDIRIELVAV
jgi:type VI secretion system protein ImpJ